MLDKRAGGVNSFAIVPRDVYANYVYKNVLYVENFPFIVSMKPYPDCYMTSWNSSYVRACGACIHLCMRSIWCMCICTRINNVWMCAWMDV
jgi:hypothetical protein